MKDACFALKLKWLKAYENCPSTEELVLDGEVDHAAVARANNFAAVCAELAASFKRDAQDRLAVPDGAKASFPTTPCSDFVLSLFPKPCIPRKHHACRLCGQRIEVREPCCRWSGFDGGDGPWTSHAHPECYHDMEGKDYETWESLLPGDLERPAVRMYWPNAPVEAAATSSETKQQGA